MNISKLINGNKTVLALTGRLDTNTAPLLQEELIPLFDNEKAVELNFTELTFVSSAGLRVLLMGQKAANANDAAMTISNVSEEIMEVLDMTGFSDLFSIV